MDITQALELELHAGVTTASSSVPLADEHTRCYLTVAMKGGSLVLSHNFATLPLAIVIAPTSCMLGFTESLG